MINEFMRLDLLCESIVPTGAGYPAGLGANQVCTLAGEIIFFLGLTAITCACLEFLPRGGFNAAMVIKKKPNKEEKKLDERLEQRRAQADKEEVKIDVEGRAFTWEKLCYTVPVKGGNRQLLNSVDGYCKPGTLTALMGASGAGKTTLLDVLADRKSVGKIEGDRLIEGKPVGLAFQRGCGYAEQQGECRAACTSYPFAHTPISRHSRAHGHRPRGAALLGQPAPGVRRAAGAEGPVRRGHHRAARARRHCQRVDRLPRLRPRCRGPQAVSATASLLGHISYPLLPVSATIAVELAAKPNQLLFLDEPTSGLDGQGAYTIVRLLRKLAAAGMTIL
jgi:hypothetical protein